MAGSLWGDEAGTKMSEEDKQKLRAYSKETLIGHMAASGFIHWRLLDMSERALKAQKLQAEYDALIKTLKKPEDKKTIKALERRMAAFDRLKKVQAQMYKIIKEMNA